MSRLVLIFFVFCLCIRQEAELTISVLKFVQQRDMSEYCRRRVMPSVFLGKHVVQSHTQILHFSQLEVPYSCFISVRTESGNNIILVIQLSSQENLAKACKEDDNQVVIYEMGETFGGYWGPLPESILLEKQNSTPVKYYTQHTTVSTTVTIERSQENSEDVETTTKKYTKKTILQPTEPDYFMVEVPLVNVSAHMERDENAHYNVPTDEIFDLFYDVTRRRGQYYESSMMPLVQFSISPQSKEGERSGGGSVDGDEPRYQLDYEFGQFTPDPRLSFWNLTGNTKKVNKYPYSANRRLNFKKSKGHPFLIKDTPSHPKKPFSHRSFDLFTKRFVEQKTSISWPDLEEFLENINNRSTELQRAKENGIEYKNISSILQKIANQKPDISAYLTPNKLSVNNKAKLNKVTRFAFNSYTRNKLLSASSTTHIPDKVMETTVETTTVLPNMAPTIEISSMELNAEKKSKDDININSNDKKSLDQIIVQKWNDSTIGTTTISILNENQRDFEYEETITNSHTENEIILNFNTTSNDSKENSSKVTTGTMVDHESWENVVQAAPVIVGHLNQPLKKNTKGNIKARKKRHIQAVPVEEGRSHSLSTRPETGTSPEPKLMYSDMQDFAELAELQDDEIHGRISFGYLRHYVGETLFNICEFREVKPRHVFLFNSSRILIALTNFTMTRMTVVATPARTLMSPEARCPRAFLECQVSGARVCIDAMTACDGVPNCGAHDIYDEDRLRCGATNDIQHNVYLAAFTFLALLLTVFYSVHYWLKRCVPKVSDAFFIYTNGSENILYLDTIMRSPNETEDASKTEYHSKLFQDDIESEISDPKQSFFGKVKSFYGRYFFRRKTFTEDFLSSTGSFLTMYQPKKTYSFMETEIQKMMNTSVQVDMVDTSVQTGESLELEFFNEIKERMKDSVLKSGVKSKTGRDLIPSDGKEIPLGKIERSLKIAQESELSVIKFFKDARAVTEKHGNEIKSRHIDKHDVACGEEHEIQTMFYDSSKDLLSVTRGYDTERPGPSGYGSRRIRFDENLTKVLDEEAEDIDDGRIGQSDFQDLDTIEQDQRSTGRDFMRFWGSKTKKPKTDKKKTNTLKFV